MLIQQKPNSIRVINIKETAAMARCVILFLVLDAKRLKIVQSNVSSSHTHTCTQDHQVSQLQQLHIITRMSESAGSPL